MQWGTADGWTYVVLTFGLFVVGFAAIRNDRAQLKMLREESERRLAGQVIVWAHRVTTFVDTEGQAIGAVIGAAVDLVLYNGAEEPVYDLDILVVLPGWRSEEGRKDLLPPKSRRSATIRLTTIENAEAVKTDWRPNAVGIDIRWRDGQQREWHRSRDGRLERK